MNVASTRKENGTKLIFQRLNKAAGERHENVSVRAEEDQRSEMKSTRGLCVQVNDEHNLIQLNVTI